MKGVVVRRKRGQSQLKFASMLFLVHHVDERAKPGTINSFIQATAVILTNGIGN